MLTRDHIGTYQERALLHTAEDLCMYPHELLRPYISNYMLTNPVHMPGNQRVLPTASTTLVYAVEDGIMQGGLRGVNTCPVEIAGFAKQFPLLLLIEFHPGGLYPFLRIDQNELTDGGFNFIDLHKVLECEIQQAFMESDDAAKLRIRLDHIFLCCVEERAVPGEVLHTMASVVRNGGRSLSRDLAEDIYYSERQLNRMFRKYVGTGVKMFSRIVRTKQALHLMEQPGMTLEYAAYRAGYYDAAHFVKDLGMVCGITPGQYQNNMSVFYNDPFKL